MLLELIALVCAGLFAGAAAVGFVLLAVDLALVR
jgi:hypothetical protein